MTTNPALPVHRPDVTLFATGLAARLPGRWQPEPTTATVRADPAPHRIWPRGPLAPADLDTCEAQRCVLTAPDGLQLYVMPRPGRPGTFVVAPMLPAGTSPVHAQGITGPIGITVPSDAARAAAFVRRRVLPDYRFKALPAWRQATLGHRRVQLFLDEHHRPAWKAPYGHAVRLLLAEEGHRLDPATGWCYPPTDSTDRLDRAVELLSSRGYHVSVTGPAAANAATAIVPATGVRAPSPPSRRPR